MIMSAQNSLQGLPMHIIDSIVEYAMNTADKYSKDVVALTFLRSCRAFRISFIRHACATAYFGKRKARFTNDLHSGCFKKFHPPVYMYPQQVKTVIVEVMQPKLKPFDIKDSYTELQTPEYKDLLFTSARTLVVDVDIEYNGYPSSDSKREEEWNERTKRGDYRFNRHSPERYLDTGDVFYFIESVDRLARRVKEMTPNIIALIFRWAISDRSDTNQDTAKLLGEMVTKLTNGVRNIIFIQCERNDIAYTKLDPSIFTGLVQFHCSYNSNQSWMLEVAQRNAGTLCKLTIKNIPAGRMNFIFQRDDKSPIVYSCLKELTLEWEGTYNAPAVDYKVVHFPILKKLVIGDCTTLLSRAFFNGGKSLEYVSIGAKMAASNSDNKYTIFELCRLDNLRTLVLYHKRYCQYDMSQDNIHVDEIQFVSALFDISPSLRNFIYQKDAQCNSFLRMLLKNPVLSRIRKLDLGPNMLTLSQIEQVLQKALLLHQLAYCPKPEDLSFENTMTQVQSAFPLVKISYNIL